jgi:hypothetical protein
MHLHNSFRQTIIIHLGHHFNHSHNHTKLIKVQRINNMATFRIQLTGLKIFSIFQRKFIIWIEKQYSCLNSIKMRSQPHQWYHSLRLHHHIPNNSWVTCKTAIIILCLRCHSKINTQNCQLLKKKRFKTESKLSLMAVQT